MTEPYRFQFVTPDGTTLYCAGFEDEFELTGLLARRTVRSNVSLSRAPDQAGLDWPPRLEPERPRGRPSFGTVLSAAVEALGTQLDPRMSLSARAVRIQKHLAQTLPADEIPAAKTVRDFLARHPVGEKPVGNSGEKSKRARIARTGG